MTGRRPAHFHPDTSAAQASIPQPFTTDYEIRVDIPYGGYVESGLTVDITAYAADGHTLEIAGVLDLYNGLTVILADSGSFCRSRMMAEMGISHL